ncbi:MarR family winged helix-turn-helix transcriptional regulator [Streptomyces guryensis]|uniref:MarR family winged helix-turn-helix transcriptional regulator n=1 Tax=Streptomyces guryensis TaxID=2886947 RepID=UPI003556F299
MSEPGLTQQELARVLGLRESAVTALVGRLTAAGLLLKQAHPREHRAVRLELTEAGTAALRAAQPEVDLLNAELRALLGDDGFVWTAGALRQLASRGELTRQVAGVSSSAGPHELPVGGRLP